MLTPEALARVLLPQMEAAIDAGKADAPADIPNSDVRALCVGLIWLAEGRYPHEWLSDEAKSARASTRT